MGTPITSVAETTATLLPLLARSPRLRRVAELAALGQAGYVAYRALRDQFAKPSEDWEVTIRSNDELFGVAVDLIASQSSENWRAVEASLTHSREASVPRSREDSVDDHFPRFTVDVTPAESVERNLVVAGHKIAAFLNDTVASPNGEGKTVQRTPKIVFSAQTEAGQKAVLQALTDAVNLKHNSAAKRKPSLHVFTSWGHWSRRGDLPARPIESVAVTDNQVQDVVDDLKRFLDLEAEYARRGIPYHRGYLLYGPPGTGKTSAVKAIAQAAGLDLYYASLGAINADTALSDVVADVSGRSILLLEDIDSFAAARERSEDKATDTGAAAGISTTGLLNVLDGVSTPHGQIVFMTTNHREFLDPALLRPGRVDRSYYFGNPDDATVERHFTHFYSRKPLLPLVAAGRSGAEVNEILVSNMFDPESAEAVLADAPTAINRKEC